MSDKPYTYPIKDVQNLGNGDYYIRSEDKSYIKTNVTRELIYELQCLAESPFEKKLISFLQQANIEVIQTRVYDGCMGLLIPAEF